MSDRYILKDRKPVRCYDLKEFGAFMHTDDRIVKQETFGDVKVSTVFLGYDDNFADDSALFFFETRVFGGPDDQLRRRYCAWKEAEEGHREIAMKYRGTPVNPATPAPTPPSDLPWKAGEAYCNPAANLPYRWECTICPEKDNFGYFVLVYGATREECSSCARQIVQAVNEGEELKRCIAMLIGAYASFVRCHATTEPDMLPEIIEARALLSRAGKEGK